jgi:N-acetylglucosaminyldiphosphoundecaprenol N-acetyl-beta-D-mannosaminyltransferase
MNERHELPGMICGVLLDNVDMQETLNRIESMVFAGRLLSKAHQVVTVNMDFVVKSVYDIELRQILQSAELATVDGMPLVWTLRVAGVPMKERVAGSDLVPALAERAAQKGLSIYFYGARPGVADRAARKLQEQYPGLRVAGVHSPPMKASIEADGEDLHRIRAAQPDILLVALGNPKQEKWIHKYAAELHVPVLIGVGATLDFIAGTAQRAPLWMQKTGMEWFFRFVNEPRRLWKRYFTDMVVYSGCCLRQWWSLRGRHRAPGSFVDIISIESPYISVLGDLTGGSAEALLMSGKALLKEYLPLLIDVRGLRRVDTAGLAVLLALSKEARAAGMQVILAGAPPFLRRSLSALWLADNFILTDTPDAAEYASQAPLLKPADYAVIGK